MTKIDGPAANALRPAGRSNESELCLYKKTTLV